MICWEKNNFNEFREFYLVYDNLGWFLERINENRLERFGEPSFELIEFIKIGKLEFEDREF